MAEGIRQVAALPDPVGEVLDRVERPSGIVVEKTAVPMGVVAIIYESRPNVTSDAAALVRALEKFHGITLTDSQLDGIASEVGSDVFFFVHCDSDSEGCALVTGRGEDVKKIAKRKD